jgi:hypothetical protein
MNSLFLLYALTYVPLSTPMHTAREAAFIQSGVKHQWNEVRLAAEKKVPKPVAAAAFVYRVVKKEEIKLKSSNYGHWTIKKDSVHVSWGVSW